MDNLVTGNDPADPRAAVAEAFENPNAAVHASTAWFEGSLLLRSSTASVAVDLAPGGRIRLTLRHADTGAIFAEDTVGCDVGEIVGAASSLLASEAADEQDHAQHRLGPDSSEAVSAEEAARMTGSD